MGAEQGLLFLRCLKNWHLECSHWGFHTAMYSTHFPAVSGERQVPDRSFPCDQPLCSPPPLTVQSIPALWKGAGLQVARGGEGGEALLTPSLPAGPDSGRQPVGAGECCMVPECHYFVSGLIKQFGDTKNTFSLQNHLLVDLYFLNEGTWFI